MKIGTLVAARSMRVRDAGQAIVSHHSLKLEASADRTLSKAYRLSTSDRPMVGSIAKGELDEGACFFPFSLLVGAMAMEGGALKSDWKQKQRSEEERGT